MQGPFPHPTANVMKRALVCSIVASSSLLLSACASYFLPARYNFPELTRISDPRPLAQGEFQQAFQVDDRSIVIVRSRNIFLIVLATPHRLFDTCASRASLDYFAGAFFASCGSRRPIPIARIFEFQDREQMLEIMERLREATQPQRV